MDRQVCKYYLVIDSVETEVFPLIAETEVSGDFSENLLADPIYGINDLIFHADDYNLIDAVPFDDLIILRLRHFIDDYSTNWLTYSFSRNNCRFNEDEKKVTVSPDYADKYKALLADWETDYNMFNVTGRVTATGNTQTFLESLVNRSPVDPGPGYENYIYRVYHPDPGDDDDIVWLREVSLTFRADEGFIEDEQGRWVRDWSHSYPTLDTLVVATSSTTGDPDPPDQVYNWVKLAQWTDSVLTNTIRALWAKDTDVPPQTISVDYSNGVNVKSLINYLGQEFDPSFDTRSTFFWNDTREDGTPYPDYNYVATEVEGSNVLNDLRRMTLWQITDIKRPNATEKASRGDLSLKKVLQDLNAMFGGIKCFFDENEAFRIEHVSDFETLEEYDLTTNERIVKKNQYGYDKTEFPRDYKYSFVKSIEDDVIGVNLFNDTNANNSKTDSVDCQLFNTDKGGIINKPDEFPDESFFLGVIDSSFDFIQVASRLSGVVADNYPVSWPNLHHYYHRHNRDVENVIINNISVPSLSVKKLKQQVDLNILYDLFYDFKRLFQTGQGWGEVEAFTIGLKNSNLTLKLRHDNIKAT